MSKLETLQAQLEEISKQIDELEAVRQKERDRLAAEFPKRDQLKAEVIKIHGFMPYEPRLNMNKKEDLIEWILDKTIPSSKEVWNSYHEVKQQIYAESVGMTYPQWLVISGLESAGYELRKFWEDKYGEKTTNYIYTDKGLHYFSVLYGFEVIYLKGRTPIAPYSDVYVAVQSDGTTYIVDTLRTDRLKTEEEFSISNIRYGKL